MPTCFSYNRKHYELNMIGFPLILLIVFGLDRIGLILAWWELDKLGKQTNILQPKHTGTFTHTHTYITHTHRAPAKSNLMRAQGFSVRVREQKLKGRRKCALSAN